MLVESTLLCVYVVFGLLYVYKAYSIYKVHDRHYKSEMIMQFPFNKKEDAYEDQEQSSA